MTCKLVTSALVTVNSALALSGIPLKLAAAVMVTTPGMTPVASPLALVAVELIMATVVSLLVQLSAAEPVTSTVLPSDNMAVAINRCSKLTGTVAVTGVTCSAVTLALTTTRSAVALNGAPFTVAEAVITEVPIVMPVANPLLSPLLMAAMAGVLLLQFKNALLVTSKEVPSEKNAVAINC
ncbi:hypothetical protein D3C79_885290 [compost metagenome]